MKSKELRNKCNEIKAEAKRSITELLSSYNTKTVILTDLSSTPVIIDDDDSDYAFTLDSLSLTDNGDIMLSCSNCWDTTSVTNPDTDILINVLECLENNKRRLFGKKEKNPTMRTGYWHGQDAVILEGNSKDGYVILVGSGYSYDEFSKIRNLVIKDRPLEEYEDCVVVVDAEEWAEQQR